MKPETARLHLTHRLFERNTPFRFTSPIYLKGNETIEGKAYLHDAGMKPMPNIHKLAQANSVTTDKPEFNPSYFTTDTTDTTDSL